AGSNDLVDDFDFTDIDHVMETMKENVKDQLAETKAAADAEQPEQKATSAPGPPDVSTRNLQDLLNTLNEMNVRKLAKTYLPYLKAWNALESHLKALTQFSSKVDEETPRVVEPVDIKGGDELRDALENVKNAREDGFGFLKEPVTKLESAAQ
ncbi:unnamed protein product, partial [Amoebophrya sp. A25]